MKKCAVNKLDVFSTLSSDIFQTRHKFGAVGKQVGLASHAQNLPPRLILFLHNATVRFPESLLKQPEAADGG